MSFFFLLLILFNFLECFDKAYYLKAYPEIKNAGIVGIKPLIQHYVNIGRPSGKIGVPLVIEPTNFDWQFYIEHNNLKITTEPQAIEHYCTYGYFANLPHCKSFNITILFHLHNINLIDEFIEQINHFMHLNSNNKYHIKINIPIDTPIYDFQKNQSLASSDAENFKEAQTDAFYNQAIITPENCNQLIKIKRYLFKKLNSTSTNLQVIFTENTGLDVGSFFLLLDQVFKQNIEHDFIIKIHTKKDKSWRAVLTSFLNVPINKLLNHFDVIYSNRLTYNFQKTDFSKDHSGFHTRDRKNLEALCTYFNIQPCNFPFCAGTMFIASSKFTEFFRSYDLLKIYALLPKQSYQKGGMMEHAFERLFGLLFKHLGLSFHILDYYTFGCFKQDDWQKKVFFKRTSKN